MDADGCAALILGMIFVFFLTWGVLEFLSRLTGVSP